MTALVLRGSGPLALLPSAFMIISVTSGKSSLSTMACPPVVHTTLRGLEERYSALLVRV